MLKSFIDLAEGRTRTLKPSPATCLSSTPVLDRGEMGEEGGRGAQQVRSSTLRRRMGRGPLIVVRMPVPMDLM